MSDTYRVVPYDPSYRSQVASLQTHLWSPDPAFNLEYFAWKYERNPYTPAPLIYLVLQGETAVGMRGFFGARWEVAGSAFDVPCACDLVITPAHRDKGLVTLLMRQAMQDLGERGYPHVFNLSGGSALTHLAQLSLGWKGAGGFEILRWSQPESAPVAWLRRMAKRLRSRYRSARRGRPVTAAPPPPSVLPPGRMGPVEARAARLPRSGLRLEVPNPAALARVVSSRPPDPRIRHIRDAGYFGWRLQNPITEYRAVVHEGPSGPDGYLLLARSRLAGASSLLVGDWAGTESAMEATLDAALAWSGSLDLRIWAVSLPPTARQLLASRGFSDAEPPASAAQPRRTLFVGRTGAERWTLGETPLLSSASWSLSMIFSDGL
jgi:GNAT acetyltransferase-like protein